jgi:hypothetical protein
MFPGSRPSPIHLQNKTQVSISNDWISGLKGYNMHLGLEGKVVLVTGKRLSDTNSTRQNTTLIAITLQEAQKASAAPS